MCRLEVLFLRKTSALATPAQLKLEMTVCIRCTCQMGHRVLASKIPKRTKLWTRGKQNIKVLSWNRNRKVTNCYRRVAEIIGNTSKINPINFKAICHSINIWPICNPCPCPIIGLQYQHLIYPFFHPETLIIILLILSVLLHRLRFPFTRLWCPNTSFRSKQGQIIPRRRLKKPKQKSPIKTQFIGIRLRTNRK